MIEQYIDSAIIIDDQENEIANLVTILESKDIWVKHHEPKLLKERTSPLKPCKIIFLDLELERDKTIENNIAIIRKIFSTIIGMNFCNYGIVVWSKHANEIEQLKTRVNNDKSRYTSPLFIVGVDKTKYLKDASYDTLFEDIDEVLMSDTGASFFLYWDKLVDNGKIETIQNIYSAIPFNENANNNLRYLLYRLALNQTGIPAKYTGEYKLENDVVKALADMLHYEVVHMHSTDLDFIGSEPDKLNFDGDDITKRKLFAQINSRLFLDFKNLDQKYVIPGNVYQVIEDNEIFSIDKIPDNSIKIVVEMTPPCDFAGAKKSQMSKILAGFIVQTMSESKKKDFSKDNCYKELDGLMISGMAEPQMLRFDFRYSSAIKEADLQSVDKFKLLFRFKDKLFADILQKMSSYSSRLGIPMIK